ncbi:hypothetical protein GCM10010946_35710 [Undibacterium squillarum]|uniref:Uncharacterized protein n=1 Tax=Undibacterium squillarum TaxID=1131567 RepID=A0ABQ2Y3G3_9BURK|nr:hypothetical protein GCM10010946_35710 [Undibacterium squillarum]
MRAETKRLFNGLTACDVASQAVFLCHNSEKMYEVTFFAILPDAAIPVWCAANTLQTSKFLQKELDTP